MTDKQPDRVLGIFSHPYCNSDDESGSDGEGGRVFIINKKEQRSVSATTFVHKLESRRLKFVRAQKGAKRTNIMERVRVAAQEPVESDISFHLPPRAPLDYFDPAYYNDLPVQTRFDYSKNGVALPLVQYHDNKDWKTMDKATFMEKYDNDVLKLYDIPTKEEMEGKGNEGWEEENVADDLMEE